jgi:hypothetical protein
LKKSSAQGLNIAGGGSWWKKKRYAVNYSQTEYKKKINNLLNGES